ncbi:hypothetical protein BDV19DRAFT_337487 [Aspergillus venezuelensis]
MNWARATIYTGNHHHWVPKSEPDRSKLALPHLKSFYIALSVLAVVFKQIIIARLPPLVLHIRECTSHVPRFISSDGPHQKAHLHYSFLSTVFSSSSSSPPLSTTFPFSPLS